jgi:hypothetical protein
VKRASTAPSVCGQNQATTDEKILYKTRRENDSPAFPEAPTSKKKKSVNRSVPEIKEIIFQKGHRFDELVPVLPRSFFNQQQGEVKNNFQQARFVRIHY